MLVLLDKSAAFDAINTDILLNTLASRFSIGDTAFDWLRSYLTGRSQCVMIGSNSNEHTTLPLALLTVSDSEIISRRFCNRCIGCRSR